LQDVAQPVGAADRQVKKELKKKIRGLRDLERQAENSPSQEAQVVADDGLALRTVMRDEGTYPLEPPGVQLDQQWQRMAASVERVMAAHPAALLKRLSRMRAVWHVCHKEVEQFVILCRWIHQIAHLWKAEPSCEEAQSPRLTCGHALQHSGLPTELWRVVTYMEKITSACAPHLCESWKPPLRPRTTKELARLIGRLKKSRRHITGRKHTQECILREGSVVARRFGLPETNNWVDACARLHANDVQQILTLLRQTEKRRQCWYTRRD
jgi:hypothetical protein